MPSRAHQLRAVLFTVLAVAPLGALIVFAAHGLPAGEWPAEETPADGLREIALRAYAWGFSPRVVRVNPGDTVRFIVESEDISHGFAVNELGINVQLRAERETRTRSVKIEIPKGTYTIHCSVFCGLGHPSMKAHLVVGNPGPPPGSALPWIASLAGLAGFAAFAGYARGGRGSRG